MQNRALLQVWITFLLLFVSDPLVAQTWNGTSTPTTTSDYNTSIRLTHIAWGSHHGILFNSHPRSVLNDGNLLDNGNVEQDFDAGPYSSGAGAIMFLGNAGRMDFLISGPSSGVGQPVDWGGSKLTIQRDGNIGIGTYDPEFKLDIVGFGTRIKNPSADFNAYTTFRIQGPDYTNGLEIDFFGNNNFDSDPNVSYGGGVGSAAIVNVNPKPLILGTNNQGRVFIDGSGNVAIGTNDAKGFKLAVAGNAIAEEIVVKLQSSWPDYVFDGHYKLPVLSELEEFIRANKHLPDVPTAGEVKQNGLSVGEMNAILLKKVEELTMYVIEQDKTIKKQEERIESLENKIKQ